MPYKLAVLLSIVLLAACEPQAPPAAGHMAVTTPVAIARDFEFAQIMRGGRLYQQHCAVCHGRLGQGAENWRQRDAEGRFPPPPLNGTGHTWHHPTAELVEIIREGTGATGGNMPAWKDVLSRQDIDDLLVWIQAQWPDEIYAAWHAIEQRSLE